MDYWETQYSFDPPIFVVTSDDWNGHETASELRAIERVLLSITDTYDHHPHLTAYVIQSTPDFTEIIRNTYTTYAWASSYEGSPDALAEWRRLDEQGTAEAQFHGREHFNVPLWQSLLQSEAAFQQAAAERRVSPEGFAPKQRAIKDKRYLHFNRSYIDASMNPPRALSLEKQKAMVESGVDLFRKHFGRKPESVICPGYVFDARTCDAMYSHGIRYVGVERQRMVEVDSQGLLCDGEPVAWFSNLQGLRPFLVNTPFEPEWAKDSGVSPEEAAQRAIAKATSYLKSGVPVVMRTHAVNYVRLSEDARRRNLECLRSVITTLQQRYPRVCFLSAGDLCRYLYEDGRGAQRKVPFKIERLSVLQRLCNTANGIWTGYPRFRWFLWIALALFMWAVLLSIPPFRRRLKATCHPS